MTLEEFSSSMDRLRGIFGERYYPAGRVTAFWEELESTESALWQAAIHRLILEEAQPPMMKQIRMALAQEREKRNALEWKRISNPIADEISPEQAKANASKVRAITSRIGKLE